MNTLENLSFDDCPYDELAEGSSDEYDRYQGEEMILSDSLSELSPVKQLLTPSNIVSTILNINRQKLYVCVCLKPWLHQPSTHSIN